MSKLFSVPRLSQCLRWFYITNSVIFLLLFLPFFCSFELFYPYTDTLSVLSCCTGAVPTSTCCTDSLAAWSSPYFHICFTDSLRVLSPSTSAARTLFQLGVLSESPSTCAAETPSQLGVLSPSTSASGTL